MFVLGELKLNKSLLQIITATANLYSFLNGFECDLLSFQR